MTDMLLEWDNSFLIGIDELDYEHKALIDDINSLHKELAEHNAKSEIEKCLGEIHARMQAHFALEERVMKDGEYEHFDEHKDVHDALLDTYTEYMIRYLDDVDACAGNAIEEFLKRWVIDHILTSDKKMSLMVQAKN
jgi:hemerythrin